MKLIELVKTIMPEHVELEVITYIEQSGDIQTLEMHAPEQIYYHPHFQNPMKLLYKGAPIMVPLAYSETEIDSITVNDDTIVAVIDSSKRAQFTEKGLFIDGNDTEAFIRILC